MLPDDLEDEEPLDEEPFIPVREGGIVQTYSLVFVCVLGLIAGGAVALALHHARQGAAEVRGVAGKSPEVGREAGAVAAESPADDGARAEDTETRAAGGEAADEFADGTGASAGKVVRSRSVARLRAGARESGGEESRAARRYAGATGRQVAAGGRGVGGHALGGVKKTGEGVKKTGAAIGKTFGKIGGVFHE
jgi:hypothetical protein